MYVSADAFLDFEATGLLSGKIRSILSIVSFQGSLNSKHDYSHDKRDYWLRTSEAKILDDLAFMGFAAVERVCRGRLAKGLDQEYFLDIFGLFS